MSESGPSWRPRLGGAQRSRVGFQKQEERGSLDLRGPAQLSAATKKRGA